MKKLVIGLLLLGVFWPLHVRGGPAIFFDTKTDSVSWKKGSGADDTLLVWLNDNSTPLKVVIPDSIGAGAAAESSWHYITLLPSSQPTGAVGRVYCSSSDSTVYVYNGSEWVPWDTSGAGASGDITGVYGGNWLLGSFPSGEATLNADTNKIRSEISDTANAVRGEYDTQGEVETIWGVTLATDTEAKSYAQDSASAYADSVRREIEDSAKAYCYDTENELTTVLDDNYNWFTQDSIDWDTLGAYPDTGDLMPADTLDSYLLKSDTNYTDSSDVAGWGFMLAGDTNYTDSSDIAGWGFFLAADTNYTDSSKVREWGFLLPGDKVDSATVADSAGKIDTTWSPFQTYVSNHAGTGSTDSLYWKWGVTWADEGWKKAGDTLYVDTSSGGGGSADGDTMAKWLILISDTVPTDSALLITRHTTDNLAEGSTNKYENTDSNAIVDFGFVAGAHTDSEDVNGWNYFNIEGELTTLLDDNYNWFTDDSVDWDTLGNYLLSEDTNYTDSSDIIDWNFLNSWDTLDNYLLKSDTNYTDSSDVANWNFINDLDTLSSYLLKADTNYTDSGNVAGWNYINSWDTLADYLLASDTNYTDSSDVGGWNFINDLDTLSDYLLKSDTNYTDSTDVAGWNYVNNLDTLTDYLLKADTNYTDSTDIAGWGFGVPQWADSGTWLAPIENDSGRWITGSDTLWLTGKGIRGNQDNAVVDVDSGDFNHLVVNTNLSFPANSIDTTDIGDLATFVQNNETDAAHDNFSELAGEADTNDINDTEFQAYIQNHDDDPRAWGDIVDTCDAHDTQLDWGDIADTCQAYDTDTQLDWADVADTCDAHIKSYPKEKHAVFTDVEAGDQVEIALATNDTIIAITCYCVSGDSARAKIFTNGNDLVGSVWDVAGGALNKETSGLSNTTIYADSTIVLEADSLVGSVSRVTVGFYFTRDD